MTEQEKERSTVGETMTAEPWNSQACQETRQSFFFFSSALLPLGLHLCLPPGWINNKPSPSSWQLERSGSLIEVVVDGGRWSLAGALVSVVTLRCPLVGF